MAVQVSHLTKQFGDQKAVDDLSFAVEPGEVLGFLGPNGAGKSTTMKIITCFLSPTAGTVNLGDFNIIDHPEEIRRRIGYLPEHNPLYLDMYVWEFLQFAGRIYRLPQTELDARIEEVVIKTGLEPEQHKQIGMLSKGYRQRVGLAQAILHDPELLILDEPTSGLDPNQIVEIRTLIKTLGQDRTVIFSSHILSEVESIADRVIIINQGKLIADAPVGELREMVQDEVEVLVETQEPGLDLSKLQTQPGVKSIKRISPTRFLIITDAGTDIRPEVFAACVDQGQVLIGLNREALTLEETFRKLTGQNRL